MSVHIEIQQIRSVDEGPVFKVDTKTTYAAAIQKEIFVFQTDTQDFSHVATVYDMETYPNDYDTAVANSDEYYRKDQAVVGYAVQQVALDAAIYTAARVDSLAHQYNTLKTSFEGSFDYIFTG
jgi:hypothetical protein